MSGIVTVNQAAKEQTSLEYKAMKATYIGMIEESRNPRKEPIHLHRLGYELVNKKDKEHSLLHMALNEDIENARKVVKLFEEHENDPPGFNEEETDDELGNIQFKEDAGESRREQSIIALSRSMRIMQLQPVVVSENAKILWFGQRRLAAIIYLHAKSRVEVHDKVKGAKLFPPVIQTVEANVTREQGFDMAVRENAERKDFTPLQWGVIFNEYTKIKNPKTKKVWTLKEIAGHLNKKYGIVRNRRALVLPRVDDVRDEEGNLVTPGKGLTDEDRAALESGQKTLTWATRRALGEQHYSTTGERQSSRKGTIPLKEIQKLFDETSEANTERRKAFAEVMGLTLAKAEKESEERIQKAESSEMKGGKGKGKGKKGGKGKKKATAPQVQTTAEEDTTETPDVSSDTESLVPDAALV